MDEKIPNGWLLKKDGSSACSNEHTVGCGFNEHS